MAILDSTVEFSDAQAVTASAISNVIDTIQTGISGNLVSDIGGTSGLYLTIGVPVTAVSAGASTVTFSLESDSTADLATSPSVHWITAAIPKASLVAGYRLITTALPQGAYKRYIGIRYTVGTANLSAGNFDAFLHVGIDNQRYYATRSVIQ